ncbi:ligase [Polaribacter pacificus]|uniref:Ligase n=1 Tax=Polaribacter pacificus TaxID=1775173 RepID=A0A917HZE3_9FLAO|nr:O-antigen ligase family protein [Polaribacter pacificus]GGG99499.1 ligase [Polaribacter pacificus]
MFNYISNNRLFFIVAHLIIGYLATFDVFAKPFGFTTIIVGILVVLFTSNKNEEAFKASCYIVGVGVFARMISGFPTYEAGKYAIMIFLILGVFVGEVKQKFSLSFVFYLLLLLLGIVLTEVPVGESIRKAIAFNLTGPFLLGISALYFFKRVMTIEQVYQGLFIMLLPLFSLVTYLYFVTPNLEDIIFGGGANFDTSGGFGPNQVATAIGIGIFIIAINILTKRKITGFIALDIIFLMYFIYRGLLTFSRGGILTGAAAILVFAFFYILNQKASFKLLVRYSGVTIFALIGIWLYTSNVTGGMLYNRYAGKNALGVKKKDITSGRALLLQEQMSSFIYNPMGIGVGNGKYKRELSEKSVTAASHNEIGRLLEEHGLIGLILLILLLFIPLENIWFSNNYQRAFLISFYVFWFFTINHSAMRIAFSGFVYALSLIKIQISEDD